MHARRRCARTARYPSSPMCSIWRENPCRGVRKNKEQPRDYYAEEDVWIAVYEFASDALKDAMDLNYLTGQRPADVLKMKLEDVRGDELRVRQGKRGKLLR